MSEEVTGFRRSSYSLLEDRKPDLPKLDAGLTITTAEISH